MSLVVSPLNIEQKGHYCPITLKKAAWDHVYRFYPDTLPPLHVFFWLLLSVDLLHFIIVFRKVSRQLVKFLSFSQYFLHCNFLWLAWSRVGLLVRNTFTPEPLRYLTVLEGQFEPVPLTFFGLLWWQLILGLRGFHLADKQVILTREK